MAHPRWPGFNTKTGNPIVDNANRRLNRHMWRSAQHVLRIHAAGRKRRKYLLTVEGGRYLTMVAALMSDLARRDRDGDN
jgi:hypothetical protein